MAGTRAGTNGAIVDVGVSGRFLNEWIIAA